VVSALVFLLELPVLVVLAVEVLVTRGGPRPWQGSFDSEGVGRSQVEMRVIDLDTGDTLQAANDDDLVRVVEHFYEERGKPIEDDEARRLVAQRAYEATDS
jgi:hypothetical protein